MLGGDPQDLHRWVAASDLQAHQRLLAAQRRLGLLEILVGLPLEHALHILDRHEESAGHAVDGLGFLHNVQQGQLCTGRQECLRVREDLLSEW